MRVWGEIAVLFEIFPCSLRRPPFALQGSTTWRPHLYMQCPRMSISYQPLSLSSIQSTIQSTNAPSRPVGDYPCGAGRQ